jgi:hypothetical protein
MKRGRGRCCVGLSSRVQCHFQRQTAREQGGAEAFAFQIKARMVRAPDLILRTLQHVLELPLVEMRPLFGDRLKLRQIKEAARIVFAYQPLDQLHAVGRLMTHYCPWNRARRAGSLLRLVPFRREQAIEHEPVLFAKSSGYVAGLIVQPKIEKRAGAYLSS